MTRIEELEALYEKASLGPCAVHPAIARIDEMTEEGPDPVLALAFPHDRRSEDQTYAIGRLVCALLRDGPALLAVVRAAKELLGAERMMEDYIDEGTSCDGGASMHEIHREITEAKDALRASLLPFAERQG